MKVFIVKLRVAPNSSNIKHIVGGVGPHVDQFGIISSNYSGPLEKLNEENLNGPGIAPTSHKVLNYVLIQLFVCLALVKHREKPDLLLFYTGGLAMVPMHVMSNLLSINSVTIFTGSPRQSSDSLMFSVVLGVFEQISCRLSDIIIVYSQRCIDEFSLEKFRHKIVIFPTHHIDRSKFSKNKNINDREFVVGFVGRLNRVKGAHKLIKAADEVDPSIVDEIRILGDGPLFDEMQEYIVENGLEDIVSLEGWVEREHVSEHLNEMKLLVMPSKTEGLPMAMLQAMACGTPVLASEVGAIPDMINEGNNGFLLSNTTPEEISNRINETISKDDLKSISNESERFIKKNFTRPQAVDRWASVFAKFGS